MKGVSEGRADPTARTEALGHEQAHETGLCCIGHLYLSSFKFSVPRLGFGLRHVFRCQPSSR